MNPKIIELLFKEPLLSVNDYELKYPKRTLNDNAYVTRYAPSPTGFVHMGALYTSFINQKLAKQTGGLFYLRVEDTDKKREVENAVNDIVKDLANFGIKVDEGITLDGIKGEYGPYLQSERRSIYHTFAKNLCELGYAYPCFCSEEAIASIRRDQELNKTRIGYYGEYAICRTLTDEEIISKLENNEPYVLRLKSPGDFDNKEVVNDLIKGRIEFPENDLDIVVLKADGIPTYHFAHIADDYLMRTTHVIRGDEWLSSLPIHVQLFKLLELPAPAYAHIAPLVKKDGDSKRKLSKRKDPEAAVSYYHEHGIPNDAVMLYLATVSNSNFEEWLDHNPGVSIDNFELTFDKMAIGGSMFDLEKLLNISKNYLASLTAEQIYDMTLEYTEEYDTEFANILKNNKKHATSVFNIERGSNNKRKDISALSDMKREFWYMFDELFYRHDEPYMWQIQDKELRDQILEDYIANIYDSKDDNSQWFNKLKDLAERHGYAREMKEYKAEPDKYKGHIADIATLIRVAITSQNISPDLYSLMNLLTLDQIKDRINRAIEK